MKAKILICVLPVLLVACNGNEKVSDASGNFEAKEIIVSAEAQGKLLEFNIEEGDKLSKDLVVGYIDTVPLSIQKEQLQAQKEVVKTKLVNVKAQIEVQEEQKDNLEVEKNRINNLYKDNAATQKQLDEIEGNYSVLEKQIATTKTQISFISKEMDVYNKQIKLIDDKISRAKITNPINGTVLEKYLEESEIAIIGKALYKIAYLDEIELRIYVSGAQLSTIQIGQKVRVLIDKDEELYKEYQGEIFWISDQTEFTPKIIQTKEERVNMVYAVKIKVKNDGKLKIGMPAEVKFI
ncbi:MAG: HlyD family secretion protein [Marinilabiliales bacterium]|nr:MAG: HlyD family secretion protein [Marinilabiliales bacterium]